MRKYIEDPDSFKSEPPTDNNQTAKQNDDNKSMVDRLVEGRLFKEHDVEIKNLKTFLRKPIYNFQKITLFIYLIKL